MASSRQSEFTVRPWFMLLFLGVPGLLLTVFFLFFWFLLPRWQPAFVLEHSPWFTPAFEAAVVSGRTSDLAIRINDWGDSCVTELSTALVSKNEKRAVTALEMFQALPDNVSREPLLHALALTDELFSIRIISQLKKKEMKDCFEPVKTYIAKMPPEFRLMAAFDAQYLPEMRRFDLTDDLRNDHNSINQAVACLLLARDHDPRSLEFIKSKVGKLVGKYSGFGRELDPALLALVLNESPDSFSALLAELKKPDLEHRRRIIGLAFSWRGSDPLFDPIFRQCYDDPDQYIRRRATEYIVGQTDAESIALVRRGLSADDERAKDILGFIENQNSKDLNELLLEFSDLPNIGPMVLKQLSEIKLTGNAIDRLFDLIERNPTAERRALLSSVDRDDLSPMQAKRYDSLQALSH